MFHMHCVVSVGHGMLFRVLFRAIIRHGILAWNPSATIGTNEASLFQKCELKLLGRRKICSRGVSIISPSRGFRSLVNGFHILRVNNKKGFSFRYVRYGISIPVSEFFYFSSCLVILSFIYQPEKLFNFFLCFCVSDRNAQ